MTVPGDPGPGGGPTADGPCLTDAQFQQFLEAGVGIDTLPEAYEGFLVHLEQCGTCQERLGALQSLDPAYQDLIRHGLQPVVVGPEVEAFVRNLRSAFRHPSHAALVQKAAALTQAAVQVGGLGGDPIGPYRIERCAGMGGMSVVYEAFDTRLNRAVALKMLLVDEPAPEGDPRRERLAREASMLAALHHPHIVPVYELGEHRGQPYLVLEYVAGGTLARWAGGRPLPAAEAAAAVQTLALAVQYAHEQGVIHRDLKPSNVLLQPVVPLASQPLTPPAATLPLSAYRLMLSDLGLARWREQESALTRSDHPLGTPAYMAPEQIGGRSSASGAAVDLYALGAILYELLTGRPPLQGSSVAETLRLIQESEPLPSRQLQPGVPLDLETIALKCLEKDPKRRYATAGALAEDLGRFLSGRSIRARRVSLPGRAARWCRRHPGQAVMGTLTLASLLALALGGVGSAWVQARLRRLAESRERQALAAQQQALVAQQVANANLRDAIAAFDNFAASLKRLEPALDPQLQALRRSSSAHAIRWCQQYLTQAPDEAHWSPADLRVAVILVKLQVSLGQAGAAEPMAHQARLAADRLSQQIGDDPTWGRLVHATYQNLSDVHTAADRPAEAMACLSRIGQFLEASLAARPDQPEILAQHGFNQGQIADLAERLGDLDGALAAARASLDDLLSLQRLQPGIPAYQTMAPEQAGRVAALLDRLGRRAEARALLGQALANLDHCHIVGLETTAGFQAARQGLLRQWCLSVQPEGPEAFAAALQTLQAQAADPDPAPPQPLLLDLAAHCVQTGPAARAQALVEQAAADPDLTPAQAIELAALSATLGRDPALDPAARPGCLELALALLDRARAAGALDEPGVCQALGQRPAFEPLRDRPDFLRLLRPAAPPSAP